MPPSSGSTTPRRALSPRLLQQKQRSQSDSEAGGGDGIADSDALDQYPAPVKTTSNPVEAPLAYVNVDFL